MRDYSGPMDYYQRQLDKQNIKFDISEYIGCTARELQEIVDSLIRKKVKEA